MGVNLSGLGLMALARASGADFSRVVTLGRHQVHIPADAIEDFFRVRGRADLASGIVAQLQDGYCEPLLKAAFGAGVVHSIDASAYEHADIIHDMNTPLVGAATYSVVMDLGTLEHVFNVPVAFDNTAKLAALNGHILHVLPGNNFVGHGFYQFSPEFFYQLYAPERGFANTRVFAAPDGDPSIWYEVRAPRELRARVNITSREQLYLLVITQKVSEPAPLVQQPIQQSDYLTMWEEQPVASAAPRRRGALARTAQGLLGGLKHRRKVAQKDVRAARADMIAHRVLALTSQF